MVFLYIQIANITKHILQIVCILIERDSNREQSVVFLISIENEQTLHYIISLSFLS